MAKNLNGMIIKVGEATNCVNGKMVGITRSQPPVSSKITGKVIRADTHAEFINKMFGKSYINIFKSTWQYTDRCIVWMVRFYGKTEAWINRFTDKTHTRIVEYYESNESEKEKIDFPPLSHRIRIAVAIEERGVPRRYTVEGVFEFDEKASTRTKRYYNKISDDLPIDF